MGYDYIFYLTVDKLEEFEEFQEDAVDLHAQLTTFDWFPAFGSSGHSGSKGYGCGSNEHLLPEFMKFTSAFPKFTFKLWLSHWDNSDLYMVEVRNDIVISEAIFNGEDREIMPGCRANYCFKDLNLENDITDWFTE